MFEHFICGLVCSSFSTTFRSTDTTLDEVGQKSYFGSTFTRLPHSSITFHTVGHHRVLVILAVLLHRKAWPFSDSAVHYLTSDMSTILQKNISVQQKNTQGCWLAIQKPDTLVTNGFIGIGDSVAPKGHSSIAIAMLLGTRAAELAVKALTNGDVS